MVNKPAVTYKMACCPRGWLFHKTHVHPRTGQALFLDFHLSLVTKFHVERFFRAETECKNMCFKEQVYSICCYCSCRKRIEYLAKVPCNQVRSIDDFGTCPGFDTRTSEHTIEVLQVGSPCDRCLRHMQEAEEPRGRSRTRR